MLHKMLGNVMVECLMFPGICLWKGEYSSAETHLQTSCDERRTRCSACSEIRSAANMSMHKQYECVAAPTTCGACQLSLPRYEMDHHVRVTCSAAIIPCIQFRKENVAYADTDANELFACTKLVRRANMCVHLATECVDARVMCWMCKAEYTRGHQSAHMMQALSLHHDRLAMDRKSVSDDVRTAPTIIVCGTQLDRKQDVKPSSMLRYDMERNLWTTMRARINCEKMDVFPRENTTDTDVDVMMCLTAENCVVPIDTAIVKYAAVSSSSFSSSSKTIRAKHGGTCDRIHALSKTRVLLIGGFVVLDVLDAKNDKVSTKHAVSTCMLYDTETDVVALCAPMKHARVHASSVRVGNTVYVVGGTDRPDDTGGMNVASSTMEQYDIKADKWSMLPSHPTPVMGAPMVATPYGLVLAGGYRPVDAEGMRFSISNVVTCFSFVQRTWRSAEWVLPRKMEDFGLVYWRSRFIIMGGLTSDSGGRRGTGTTVCTMYDERTLTWTNLSNLPTSLVSAHAILACT
jgi:hypothetical protein